MLPGVQLPALSLHRPLVRDDLLGRGRLQRLGRAVVLLAEVDSTSAYLLRHADQLPDGTIAWAEYQTAGRGRLGRRWEAPRGSSVLLSVLLLEPNPQRASGPGRPGRPSPRRPSRPGAAQQLPGPQGLARRAVLAGCVAACEAIEATVDCQPSIRWPNDIACRGRKLGGVLVETRRLEPGPQSPVPRLAIVVGIGINCLQHQGHFPPPLAGRATSLELESPGAVDRAALAGRLVERLDAWLSDSPGPDGATRLADAWRQRCEDVGASVTLLRDGQCFRGTVLEITDQADLIVQLEHGARRQFGATTTTRLW